MKRTLITLSTFGCLLLTFSFSRNIMPIWRFILPGILVIVLAVVNWKKSKMAVVITVVIAFSMLLFFNTEPSPTDDDEVVIHGNKCTYVVYNNCFLYCSPHVYKKITYLPFLKFHKHIKSEQSIKLYFLEQDTIYLHNGIRTWKLLDN